MNAPCEPFEIEISALLDGELEHAALLAALDHVVRCASCRAFYRDARALEGVARATVAEDIAAPTGLWPAIATAATPRRRQVARWVARAAAVAVLVVGAVLLLRGTGEHPIATGELAGESGAPMTEERFVELAREVLHSEPRFQRAMFRVMDEALDELVTDEGGGEVEEPIEGPGERGAGRA